MASSINPSFILFFTCSLFIHLTLGEIVCEELGVNVCAFSIASSGKRCLLENWARGDGKVEYQCKTSEVIVGTMSEHIESDQCVNSCGVDRNNVGISSDSLMDSLFTAKLCSPACYQNCPNIVDLYFNLAAGEGVFLPDLCQKQRSSPHRAMLELLSNGGAASGDAGSEEFMADSPAPTPAPSSF